MATFNLQGHRGARGLAPENTLPSFELALDHGATSLETDLHLTADDIPVLAHDPLVEPTLFRLPAGASLPDPATLPPVRTLKLAQLRGYRADVNPDPKRFPDQKAAATPLATWYARERGIDPFAVPVLADLFDFARAYAGEPGRRAGKSDERRAAAERVVFDLELKRVPYHPELMGDAFDGTSPGTLERKVHAAVQAAGVASRTVVRSFDHRAVRVLRQLDESWTLAVLIADTAPVSPADLARAAGASMYCPDYRFLDEKLVRACRGQGIQVVPWTVNEPSAWRRLVDWGVDGLTTDFPDRLARFLREAGIRF